SLDNRRSLVTSMSVPSFKHFVYFDVVIGKPFEVAAPARGHFLFAANLITVSIDESMILAHQLGQTFNVVCVEAIDECKDCFSSIHLGEMYWNQRYNAFGSRRPRASSVASSISASSKSVSDRILDSRAVFGIARI